MMLNDEETSTIMTDYFFDLLAFNLTAKFVIIYTHALTEYNISLMWKHNSCLNKIT